MKSHIWRWAAVGVFCVSVSSQGVADERGDGNPQQGRVNGGQPYGTQDSGGHHLGIQPRPDSVQQTQPPRRGYYDDVPRRPHNSSHWQTDSRPGYDNGPRPGFNNGRPQNRPWPGRPNGYGNGWGAGPQYRPGHLVDRFPDKHWQVPYRGHNYFFSNGYWYRPEGPRYIVVRPPYGIRVGYLPDYAREVWVGSTLLFLAAGAYYAYQPTTQDYIVVQPPASITMPANPGTQVQAYPTNGQRPAQVDRDRYECYRWAAEQSGYDPTEATYAPSPAVVQTYRQAQGNCLSSRGYQVTY